MAFRFHSVGVSVPYKTTGKGGGAQVPQGEQRSGVLAIHFTDDETEAQGREQESSSTVLRSSLCLSESLRVDTVRPVKAREAGESGGGRHVRK